MLDDAALLRRIVAEAEVADALRWLVDFDVEDADPAQAVTARLSSGARLEMIACDGTGGRYFLVGAEGSSRSLLFANSEGGAGLLGPSLATALATLVALPHWHDLFKFSAGGDLGEMRRAHAHFVANRSEDPDRAQAQELIIEVLGLERLDDPVLTLWRSAHAADPAGHFHDEEDEGGGPWDPLWSEWTVERLTRTGAGRSGMP
ncbi:hypothetical protein [Actinoplanes sp. NPDC051851]|uniref:hypothetical protein n=1 Tax=Actinoplanes sp. NPDC051851 TaxID=3154753 RepID=UPI00343E8A57